MIKMTATYSDITDIDSQVDEFSTLSPSYSRMKSHCLLEIVKRKERRVKTRTFFFFFFLKAVIGLWNDFILNLMTNKGKSSSPPQQRNWIITLLHLWSWLLWIRTHLSLGSECVQASKSCSLECQIDPSNEISANKHSNAARRKKKSWYAVNASHPFISSSLIICPSWVRHFSRTIHPSIHPSNPPVCFR